MKKLPYQEGSWFVVPLRNGGYATGVVARMAPKGKIILAYFFGPRRDKIPTMSDIVGLQAKDANKCLRVGDLGLINGEWTTIGCSKDWDAHLWPVPRFIRRDELAKRAWCLIYSDSDPSKLEREYLVSYELNELEESALYGYGAAELLLTKLL
jgi:hypothetical protein